MDNRQTTFQELLSRQIKIRDLQGQWRRISSLSTTEIEQLLDETVREANTWNNPQESTKNYSERGDPSLNSTTPS
ncbi:MAG: hypothetical protein ACPGYT_07935 [Nitrospirales bacterium]